MGSRDPQALLALCSSRPRFCLWVELLICSRNSTVATKKKLDETDLHGRVGFRVRIRSQPLSVVFTRVAVTRNALSESVHERRTRQSRNKKHPAVKNILSEYHGGSHSRLLNIHSCLAQTLRATVIARRSSYQEESEAEVDGGHATRMASQPGVTLLIGQSVILFRRGVLS